MDSDEVVAGPLLAVIGIGYVGLPLVAAFGRIRPSIGFDTDPVRIGELRDGVDRTGEIDGSELAASTMLTFTSDPEAIRAASIYIVTVPTPIDADKRPDLAPLLEATELVGGLLAPGDLVVYESTVYPGATEDVCVPILEERSGLRCNADFTVGYSPERINPGDPVHRLGSILKVTSGSTAEAAERVDELYRSVIPAGTHRAPSIRVAEAAKVIENTQRDVNIALINELAVLFARLGLDTHDVLAAAGTKWNFLPFTPGLVGGHCIGVDPYYLTHKATEVGHHPEVILAGRRINDRMGAHVAETVVKLMLGHGIGVCNSRILVLGLAFKENCPDLRNTRVVDIIDALRDYSIAVDCFDPWVDRAEAKHEYAIDCLPALPTPGGYDAVILAVAHRDFIALGAPALRALGKARSILYDVKSILPAAAVDGRL